MAGWTPLIRVQSDAFDLSAEHERITAGRGDIGAIVAFTGWCRDEGGALAALELEHYPGMAEAEMARIAAEASARWPLLAITIAHRIGRLTPGDPIVLVLTASTHRKDAFDAAAFLMDFLKTRAPFWKKEQRADGTQGGWVEARKKDDDAASTWTADCLAVASA